MEEVFEIGAEMEVMGVEREGWKDADHNEKDVM